MHFLSTNNPDLRVSLGEAVLKGLPKDNGLFMPLEIEPLSEAFWAGARHMPFAELAFSMTRQLLSGSLPDHVLRQIVTDACTFDAPLLAVGDRYVLELFHGPTLAFKDFGASFMARLMGHLVRHSSAELQILVATSGDTGGAVAAGFFNVPGIQVTILYPKGKVSPVQEFQLTTWGKNIRAIEVEGTFDDCQALVKQAFLDDELENRLMLSSANSINIARLIPQSWYYARAWQQLPADANSPVFCIPSGNYGNLTGGVFANMLGLPVHRFIAASNANNVVPEFLKSGTYIPGPSIQTLSNAMDVGSPSNVARLAYLWGMNAASWNQRMHGDSVSDDRTLATIKKVYEEHGYALDPHSAVGWAVMDELIESWTGHPGILLETAHPAKFPEVMRHALGSATPRSETLEALTELQSDKTRMAADFGVFKSFLLNRL